ncbi:YwdI family protein [Ureibacillus thermosphaericus]|uniref:YwdI family protein n=1 Tax=Ureibacillus thermosphaericus TaxID=51173 RepID=UPI0030C8F10B
MISYERLFNQIERYVVQAKQTTSEQELRELLSAIRALCDVALNSEKRPTSFAQKDQVQSYVKRQIPSYVQVSHGNQLPPSTKLDEEDANGESIFDF